MALPPNSQLSDLTSTLDQAKKRYASANVKSRDAFEKSQRFLPGGNTRTAIYFEPFPLFIERGNGKYLHDLDEHRYVDFLGEYTAGLFGHSDPKIAAALHEAIDRGVGFGAHHLGEQKLAEILCRRFPALEKIRFTNSGTEANLMALSAARAFTGKNKILVFTGAYHGGGLTFVTGPGRLNFPFEFIEGRYNDIEEVRILLREHASTLAAVIVEPMASSGGCIPARKEFLNALRAETRELEILLIFDEVVTSRLAQKGLHHALGITPDLVTLGKYVAGGMTFGAFGGKAAIMNYFDPSKKTHFPHAGTFNNNVLSMAAGIVAMSEVFTEQAAEHLNTSGDLLRNELNAISRDCGYPMQFTGIGASMNVHMLSGDIDRPSDAATANREIRDLLFFNLLDRGIYIARRGMINLSLVLEKEDVRTFVAAIKAFIEDYSHLMSRA